jgi:dinuclear metal center YbgI/SA1388 family protein
MKLSEIARLVEARIPPAWAEEWDNVGLILGDPELEVRKIAISLDATEGTVEGAAALGCQMLLVHHPAIFRPVKKIVSPAPLAAMIASAIRGGIAVYSAHTNWDSSPEGVNVILSQLLGLRGVSPVLPPHEGAWGMGAIGDLPEAVTVGGLARAAKEAWGLSTLITYGDEETPLRRVALCGGAGGDLLHTTIELGADVYITADVSYHYLLHAQLTKTHLIVVNHGEMERASLPQLCRVVREASGLEVVLLENSNWTPIVI